MIGWQPRIETAIKMKINAQETGTVIKMEINARETEIADKTRINDPGTETVIETIETTDMTKTRDQGEKTIGIMKGDRVAFKEELERWKRIQTQIYHGIETLSHEGGSLG